MNKKESIIFIAFGFLFLLNAIFGRYLEEYDMVIVVKADPLLAKHGVAPWRHEKANLNLVADFINSLPSE